MSRTMLRLTALFLISTFLLAACAPQQQPQPAAPTPAPAPAPAPAPKPAAPQTITFAQHMPITSLDTVSLATYPASYEASFLIYQNLVTFTPAMQVVPDAAESWTVSADGTTWTFKLRQGLQFHDGTPLDSKAVKAHIDRIRDEKTASANRNLWTHITGVETPDAGTVVIKTGDKPFGAFLTYLAHGSGGIPRSTSPWTSRPS